MLEDETEILLEFFAPEFPDIGQSEFHFRIGAADVAVVLLGVVVFFVADNAFKDRMAGLSPGVITTLSISRCEGVSRKSIWL